MLTGLVFTQASFSQEAPDKSASYASKNQVGLLGGNGVAFIIMGFATYQSGKTSGSIVSKESWEDSGIGLMAVGGISVAADGIMYSYLETTEDKELASLKSQYNDFVSTARILNRSPELTPINNSFLTVSTLISCLECETDSGSFNFLSKISTFAHELAKKYKSDNYVDIKTKAEQEITNFLADDYSEDNFNITYNIFKLGHVL